MTASTSSWLREQARPVRQLLAGGVAAGGAQAVLLCLGAWLMAWMLARAVLDERGLDDLWPALAALVAIALARFVLAVWQRRVTFEAGAQVSESVRRTLERRLRQLGPAWATQQSRGDIVTRSVDGVQALVPYYAGYLPQVALTAVIPVVILLAALSADPWSALIMLVTAPLVPLFMILVGGAAERASQRRWSRLRRMGARFMDALSGLTTLRLCRATGREAALLAATGEAYRRETMAVLRIAFLSALVLEFFATVSIAVLAVLIGFRLMWGTLGFEQGLFVLLLAPELFLPLRALGTQRHRRMEAAAAAEDLVTLLDEPAATAAPGPAPLSPGQLVSSHITLAFERVSFGYEPDRPVLRELRRRRPDPGRQRIAGGSDAGAVSGISGGGGGATRARFGARHRHGTGTDHRSGPDSGRPVHRHRGSGAPRSRVAAAPTRSPGDRRCIRGVLRTGPADGAVDRRGHGPVAAGPVGRHRHG